MIFNTTFGQVPAKMAKPRQANPTFINNATMIYAVWSAPVTYGLAVLEYQIKIGPSGAWQSTGLGTTHLNQGYGPNQVEYYRVRCRNDVGWGEPSDETTLMTGQGSPPGQPTNLRHMQPVLGSQLSNVRKSSLPEGMRRGSI